MVSRLLSRWVLASMNAGHPQGKQALTSLLEVFYLPPAAKYDLEVFADMKLGVQIGKAGRGCGGARDSDSVCGEIYGSANIFFAYRGTAWGVFHTESHRVASVGPGVHLTAWVWAACSNKERGLFCSARCRHDNALQLVGVQDRDRTGLQCVNQLKHERRVIQLSRQARK